MIKSWHDGVWGGREGTKEENPLKSIPFVLPWLDHGIHAVPHPHGTASKPRTVTKTQSHAYTAETTGDGCHDQVMA